MNVKLEQLADEIVETDFLVVGGGVAGCMAAIRAKLNGTIDVAVMDRSVIKYSGDVFGFDDYPFLIPHPSMKTARFFWSLKPPQNLMVERKNYAKPVKVLEDIGVQIREDDGTFKMIARGGMGVTRKQPGQGAVGDIIYYRGTDIKRKLSQAVHKSGARVFDRTLMTSLITKDGAVVGATGINTRTGKYIVFKAKAVLLSAGGAWRLYSYPYSPFPQSLFFGRQFPLDHGGAIAAAYRAGAKLASMEMIEAFGLVPAGLGGVLSAGSLWAAITSKGELLEKKYPFPSLGHFSPSMESPEIERDVIFADTRPDSIPEGKIAASYFSSATDGPLALKVMKLRGGITNGPLVENRLFIRGLLSGASGILAVNEKAETSVKNLFTAGDSSDGSGGGCSNALVWGYITGDHARELTPEIKQNGFGSEEIAQVESEKKRIFAPMTRKGDVVDPLELEDYVRKINSNYIGIHKIEARMNRALELMQVMNEKFVPALAASDLRTLTHALEVQDIIQLSEIHAQSSLLRTESRLVPSQYRSDYPEQDDENWLNKLVTVENVSGEAKYQFETLL